MITSTISVALGTPATPRNITCPRGEKLRLRLVVTSGGAAADLSTYSVLLGWDTAAASTPKPAPTRVSGDATGIVDFDVETIGLLADSYAFDIWLENESTYERTLICQRSNVKLTGAVSDMNYGPAVTMAALAGTVSPGALAISGTATDVDGTLTAASFSVTVNGTAQTPTFTYAAGAWSASVTVVAGAASIVVTATDSLGATATATRATTGVTVPVLSIVTPAAGAAAVDEGPVAVVVTSAPAVAGSTPVQLYDGASATGSPGTVAGGATTGDLVAGTHQITARMTVGGTEITSAARAVDVADQLPVPVITSHTEGQQIETGTLSVWGTVTHASATPAQLTVEFDIDDAFASTTTGVYDAQAQRWEADLTVVTLAAHTIRMRAHDATSPAEWVVATPVAVSSAPDYLEFDVGSAGVNPEVELAAGSAATVTWVHQGTQETLTGLSPTITSGAGTVRMYVATGGVDSSTDLLVLNVGFASSADAGQQNLGAGYNHPAQDVTGIRYLSGFTGMECLLAGASTFNGHNLTGTLDLSGCVALRHVECYGAQVSSLVLPTIAGPNHPRTGLPHRLRLCLEGNDLAALDLNPVAPVLFDLRAAIQTAGGLTFAALTANLAVLYHWCVRDQSLTGVPAWSRLPVVEEYWAWNTGLAGTIAPTSAVLRSLQINDNSITAATLAGLTALVDILLQDNLLGTVAVDAVLNDVNAFGTTGAYTLNLDNNGNATAAGVSDANDLGARSWTVTYEPPVGAGVLSDDFNRADGPVGNDWHSPGSATAVIASSMLQRTDGGSYQIYCNPATGTLPANYTVTAVVADATIRSAFWGLILRWDGAEGVKVLCTAGALTDPESQFLIGAAATWNGGNVVVTNDLAIPASWAVNQPHTIAVTGTGTLIEVRLDGVLVCHATVATNATVTGSEYGCCGEGNNRLWDSIGTTVP